MPVCNKGYFFGGIDFRYMMPKHCGPLRLLDTLYVFTVSYNTYGTLSQNNVQA